MLPRRLHGAEIPFLYKYYRADRLPWLRSILLTHEFYFSSPSQLHALDRSEGRPRLFASSRSKAEDQLLEHFRGAPPSIWNRHVAIVREQLLAGRNARQIGELFADPFYKHMEGLRVYSMAARPDNHHLWKHFAGDHSGCCLEFEKAGPLLIKADWVDYVDTVELDVTNMEAMEVPFIFKKMKRYRPEEEVRILMLPRWSPHEERFDPKLLRRVILGNRMAPDVRKTILEWCQTRDPQLRVVEESEVRAEGRQQGDLQGVTLAGQAPQTPAHWSRGRPELTRRHYLDPSDVAQPDGSGGAEAPRVGCRARAVRRLRFSTLGDFDHEIDRPRDKHRLGQEILLH